MAEFPELVLDDIGRGWQYLSDLDHSDNINRATGFSLLPNTYFSLSKILRDLNHKIKQENFDQIAYNLYSKMIKIISGEIGVHDFVFERVGDHIILTSYGDYDGYFSYVNGRLFVTHSEKFEGKVIWEVNEENHLIVTTR